MKEESLKCGPLTGDTTYEKQGEGTMGKSRKTGQSWEEYVHV